MADEGDVLYAPLVEFITTRIWGSPRDMTDGTVMAITESNQVIGAFEYAFNGLRCQLVVMRVAPENERMCRIATAFGFKRYDIPRLRGRDKAEAIFTLGDDEWRGGRFYKEKAHG